MLPVCWPDLDGKCGCGQHPIKVGKAPLTDNGFKDAATEPETIRAWWKRWPQANVGVALEPAGLVAVDTDSPAAVAEAKELGLPPTIERVSRRPAWIYLRPDYCPVYRATNWGDSREIDLLSGGYLVVFGRHYTDCRVYLEGMGADPASAPEWVVEALA